MFLQYLLTGTNQASKGATEQGSKTSKGASERASKQASRRFFTRQSGLG